MIEFEGEEYPSTIPEIVDDLKSEAEHDYVGLWEITWLYTQILKIQSETEIKRNTLQVARGLIDNGVLPGRMADNAGFSFWQGTPDELVAQIAASWPAVGIPTLATDHCWFAKRSHYDEDGNSFHWMARHNGRSTLNG